MKTLLKVLCVVGMYSFTLQAIRPLVFFKGVDIKRRLIQLIENEKEHIKVAMYMFTDKDIAKKLIEARKRGVRIEAVVDSSTMNSSHSVADKLRDKSISVMQCKTRAFYSSMHMKCWMFQSTRLNDKYSYQPSIYSGSCNCTYNGAYRNKEMMILCFGKGVFDKCAKNFKELKQESVYIPKK
ncbi:DUF1669 domain-containing protein [Candidatus Dependentiae bacterium]|nr:DUF1669 domain-containing protein [Candidatus Dependentiae bacterium]